MILEGSVRLAFRYAAGAAASAFLAALRDEGSILATRCSSCGRVTCPARSLCPSCGERAEALVAVGPAGTLVAWTQIAERGAFGLVRLDGADTALVHRLLGEPATWRVGSRVTARLAPARVGDIRDLEGFEAVA